MKKEIKIEIYEDGKLSLIRHYLDNKSHRDNDDPSSVNYYNNGKICYIAYRQYGLLHREYKPAWIVFDYNGNMRYEEYWQNDVYHNDYGPSIIEYKEI